MPQLRPESQTDGTTVLSARSVTKAATKSATKSVASRQRIAACIAGPSKPPWSWLPVPSAATPTRIAFALVRRDTVSVMFAIVLQGMARMRISLWPSVRKCDDLSGRGLTLMTVMNDDPSQLSDDQSRAVAALIREELARRRISRQRLADQAKISISTLEKALAGRRPFTLATTIRLEEALGVALRKPNSHAQTVIQTAPAHGALAPSDLGSYS